MRKYISQVTHVVKWLFKWGFFKYDNEAKEIIRRLEFIDGSIDKCNLKNFGYMGHLDNLRKSQAKGKNLNRVGQDVRKEG